MAITVLTTIRIELGLLDLPPAFFVDYDTVGAAKQALLMQMQAKGRGEPVAAFSIVHQWA